MSDSPAKDPAKEPAPAVTWHQAKPAGEPAADAPAQEPAPTMTWHQPPPPPAGTSGEALGEAPTFTWHLPPQGARPGAAASPGDASTITRHYPAPGGPAGGPAPEPPLASLAELAAQAAALEHLERRALLFADQRERWQRGQPAPLEAYSELLAGLGGEEELLLDLLYNEILLREERGDLPGLEEYLQRFPRYEQQIRSLFVVHRALADDDAPAAPSRLRKGRGAAEKSSPKPAAAQEAGGKPQTLSTLYPGPRADPFATKTPEPLSGQPPGGDLPAWPAVPGYQIQGDLGRGGMGVVYKALQVRLKRIVALKMLRVGDLAGDEQLERFRREAEAVARLQHPNIVQVYVVGGGRINPFFSLEFCAGGSLAQ
jgi:hypothetical protein